MSAKSDDILAQLRALAPTDEDAASMLARLEPCDPFLLGLHDAQLCGWYNEETDELSTGFHIGPDDIVADIGCGDGGASQFCAIRGAHVILSDIDADALQKAVALCTDKGARALEHYVSDSDPLPIADATATRIICLQVLEHVDDPDALMAELVRIGQPGALYLLAVPDVTSERLQQEVAPPLYWQKPNHLRIFERDAFEGVARRAGLLIERRSYFSFYWAIWWLLFWECDVALDQAARHPVLDNWARTWASVLRLGGGLKLKDVFDHFMPQNQVLVARKPG